MDFHAGQCWTYRAPAGFEASRIVVGAVVSFEHGRKVICSAVIGAPRRAPDGQLETVTIPFLPMADAALRASVVELAGTCGLPDDFASHLAAWSNDPKGLTCFTVPFEGHLDRMIALQMAAIAGVGAA